METREAYEAAKEGTHQLPDQIKGAFWFRIKSCGHHGDNFNETEW